MSDPPPENGDGGVDDDAPTVVVRLAPPAPSPMSAVSAARASAGSGARGLRGEPPMPVGELAGTADDAGAVPKLESPNGSVGVGAALECAWVWV